MSLVRKYLKGWTFRSTTPALEPGAEYRLVITGYEADDSGVAVTRVGDSRLYIDGADQTHVDKIARVRVTEFDESQHVGRAELLELVGETTY